MDLVGHPRDEMAASSVDFVYTAANDLDSDLLRLPEVTGRFDPTRIEAAVEGRMAHAGARSVAPGTPSDEVAVSLSR